MKNIVGLWVYLTSLSFSIFAQIDTAYIYNTSMPYGTLDVRIAKSPTRYYYLQENVTFSYRESSPGVRTNTFRDMTSWDSSPYKEGNLRERNGNSDLFVMNYRYLLPNNYNPVYEPGYPIIIMFHGLGERGNCWNNNCYWNKTSWNPNTNSPPAPTSSTHNLLNNDHNLLHGGLKHLDAVKLAGNRLPDDPTMPDRAFPGIVVFPQNLNGWGQASKVEDAIRLLRLIIKKYNVDENRVYIHGLSNGGGAVFQALKRAPWLFAAALPMSAINEGGIIGSGMTEEVGKIPLWVFQGGKDGNPTPSKTYNTIRAFRNAGGNVRYYLYPNLGHGTWNTAYNEPDFFTWILSRRKYNPHVLYGNPVICGTTGTGVKIGFSKGFPVYQWERDGEILNGENSSELTTNVAGVYRGRFSRKPNPGPNDWEPWSDPIEVTEINPQKPDVIILGTTHLRGPGLTNTAINNTVTLKTSTEAELYIWQKNGTPIDFPVTDVDDTLKTAQLISASTSYNGQYTLVTKSSNCPSPPSDPVQLFFNNSAPQNISLTASEVDFKASALEAGVFLTWNDIITSESGYEIWRKKTGASDFEFAGRTSKNAISFFDSPLEPSTTYLYKLRAISSTGASNYLPSNDVNSNLSVTTLADQTAPEAPQELKMIGNTTESIQLTWKASVDNSLIKHYVIRVGANEIVTDSPTTSATISGLNSNTIYPVRVKAVDFSGLSSPWSNQIIASTYVTGLFYKHSTGAWEDLDDPTMIATWNDPEFTGTINNFLLTPRTQEDYFNFQFTGYIDIPAAGDYQFRITSNDGSRLIFNNQVIIDNDGIHGNRTIESDILSLNKRAYPIEVQYFDDAGSHTLTVQFKGAITGNTFKNIPDSLLRSGKPPVLTSPGGVNGLAAVADGMTKMNLSWTSPGEVELYRATEQDGVFMVVGSSSSQSFSDLSVKPGTTYYYKARTISPTGASAFSSVVSATTSVDNIAPSVPSGVTVLNKTDTHVAITWQSSSDNVSVEHYEIFLNGVIKGTSNHNGFSIDDLDIGTAYSVTVRAIDASGNASGFSSPLLLNTAAAVTYYSTATGELNNLSTWKTNEDGSGTSPASFSDIAQIFKISNRNQVALNSPWIVDGPGSRVVVPDGVTLTLNDALNGSIELEGASVLVVNGDAVPTLKKTTPGSTVRIFSSLTVPATTYGNLELLGNGAKNFQSGLTTIEGNLVIGDAITVKGGSGNESLILIDKDLIIGGNILWSPADNRIGFRFTEAKTHALTLGSDFTAYHIEVLSNAILNISGDDKTITLGSSNGGGLKLLTGSRLNSGATNFSFVQGGTINPNGGTGLWSFAARHFRFTTSTSVSSNMVPDMGSSVDSLTINITAGGSLNILQKLYVKKNVKLKNGTVHSNGNLVIGYDGEVAARVDEIEGTGKVLGDVVVEHKFNGIEDHWKDISTSVQGVSVQEIQEYIPVTGPFTGASSGNNTPSMFSWTSDGLVSFPSSGSNNQVVLEKGRGYRAKIMIDQPVLMQTTGELNQGEIDLSLNKTSNVEGWSLTGNPYASPVYWRQDASAWQLSGVGQTIAMLESANENGVIVSKYKYYHTFNSDVVIPAGAGFWVPTFSNTAKLVVKEPAKRVQTQNSSFSYLVVKLSQGSRFDETTIGFSSSGVNDFDPASDALKLTNENHFGIASRVGARDLAFNHLSDSFCSLDVPLTLQNAIPGSYQFSFSGLETLNDIGQVSLQDNYAGATVDITSPYSFTITTDPSTSGAERFVIKFSRFEIDLNTPVITADNVCGSDSAKIVINGTQPGADYIIVNEDDEVISQSVQSQGNAVEINIPVHQLIVGDNLLRAKAGFDGCSSQFIQSQVTVSYTQAFDIQVQEEVSVCVGDQAMLQVSDLPSEGTYHWLNGSGNELYFSSSGNYTTDPVNQESVLYVFGRLANGCESPKKTVHLYPDSLEIPVITLVNDTLFVQSNGNFQWMKNGYPIAGADKPYYKPIETGSYQLVASNLGCTKSSQVYYYEKPLPCTIETTIPQVNATSICGEGEVQVTVTSVQPDVLYRVATMQGESLTGDEEGASGSPIVFNIPTSQLQPGDNKIQIRAAVDDCGYTYLISTANIVYTPEFQVTSEPVVEVCAGSNVVLQAAGVPDGGSYRWLDETDNVIEGVTASSYEIIGIETTTVVKVQGVSVNNCESDVFTIQVNVLAIQLPVITLERDTMFVNVSSGIQWFFNDEAIMDANMDFYIPVENGKYSVVYDDGTCTRESDPFEYTITSIEQPLSDVDFEIYPNPTSEGKVSIRVKGFLKGNNVSVIMSDTRGSIVLEEIVILNGTDHSLQMPLRKGIYFMVLRQGKLERRKKIIIE